MSESTTEQSSREQEREAFEDWIRKDGGDLSTFGSGKHVHYNNTAVESAWEAWRVRASLAEQRTRAMREEAYWQGWCEAADWANRDDLRADRDSQAYADAMNRRLAQQREPQEAAERPANFTELWELYSRVGDAHENHGRNHEKTMEARATFHAALMRALSAPQEAGKPAACTTIADCTTPKLCLSVGTCKGYYVMPASVRESAAPVEEAGKVEPVADEPVAEFLGRRRTPEGTTEFWGVMLCDPMQDPPKGSKLYLRPTQQALSDAQRRVLDFLYGVGELEGCGFSEKPVGELGNFWWRKHLRSAFPDILAAAGGSEK